MKNKYFVYTLIFMQTFVFAQHNSALKVRVDIEAKTIMVQQDLTYNNTSADTLYTIVLNDWNHAFSSKNSVLANRFSNEFTRAFHLAKEEDRGFTKINNIIDSNFQALNWKRNKNQIDILEVELEEPILPNSSKKINIIYSLKIPNEKFTRYGFHNEGKIYLKNWLLFPAIYENGKFIKQSNSNLDDAYNASSNYTINIETPKNYSINSNLSTVQNATTENFFHFTLTGENRNNVTVILSPKVEATLYKNEFIEVTSSLNNTQLNAIQKTIVVDRITRFVQEKLGNSSVNKILVSEEDYKKQPFYGLNQLPAFLSPFSDETIFELMFLKTYLSNYLSENLKLNPRNENWIYDGIQMFLLMQYIEEYNPDLKMMGKLSQLRILKSYYLINLGFNAQYNYIYMLMARKNLDQPLNENKDKLIKFNEQISSKYKAGLSFKYLDNYLENEIVLNSVKEFISMNKKWNTSEHDFEFILKKNTSKNIDWFFNTLIETREIIDYKFGKVSKTKDSIKVKIINRTRTNVPITLYALKKDSIISKKWIDNIKTDTTFVMQRNGSDKLVLNYLNEVPEYNLRNNWKSLKGFFFNNRPFKLNFMKDLEEPYYNQIFYVPEFEFNAYDGIAIGLNLSNKSMLDKPFTFSAAPFYSPKTGSLVGKFSGMIEQNIRDDEKLYKIRYIASGSQFHYAENASYTNFRPTVQLYFRDKDFRTNKNEYVQLKQLYINREKSDLVIDNNTDNYSVFNAKYGNFQSDATKSYSLQTDMQVANSFGKIATEIHYQKLFDNNRRLSLRFYFGTFLYRSTASEYFSFGLDTPTDYMFEQNLLGRSESTGIYSQQYVYAEGGFKSKLATRYANDWITTFNGSFNIWNWIEIYGDLGIIKNKGTASQFVFDSGMHLNLVPGYFELFLPVYSSNGYELNGSNYDEKIRFVITLSPKTLISLFTRKWF